MSKRWHRFTVLLLLVVSGAAMGSLVAEAFCPAESVMTADTITVTAHAQHCSAECPMAALAEIAVTPVVLSVVLPAQIVRAAYVRPLFLMRSYQIDPAPPLKPPAA